MRQAITTMILSMLIAVFLVSTAAHILCDPGPTRTHFTISGLIASAVLAGMLACRAWRLHR